jgi:hypothetical protein
MKLKVIIGYYSIEIKYITYCTKNKTTTNIPTDMDLYYVYMSMFRIQQYLAHCTVLIL